MIPPLKLAEGFFYLIYLDLTFIRSHRSLGKQLRAGFKYVFFSSAFNASVQDDLVRFRKDVRQIG